MRSYIKSVLEPHGEYHEDDLDGFIVHFFKCKYCGKKIGSSSLYQFYLNVSRHLEKHGVRLEE